MARQLTDRQLRELEYHREHATLHKDILETPFDWDVLHEPGRRWWNAYWQMYSYLLSCNLKDQRVLIVGCGFGDDALRVARLGADVSAFDLSPDSLEIARALADREGLKIDFRQMPAESTDYLDSSFDCIVARDILHHVDIPLAMKEIHRVAKPSAIVVVNEIYSHSVTSKIRHSRIVEEIIYPRMRELIYGSGKPYITEDERKLTEVDVREIMSFLRRPHFVRHFNFVVTRLIPDRYDAFGKLDHLLLGALRPLGGVLAGRILFAAEVDKDNDVSQGHSAVTRH